MKALCCSETSANFCQTIWRHIPLEVVFNANVFNLTICRHVDMNTSEPSFSQCSLLAFYMDCVSGVVVATSAWQHSLNSFKKGGTWAKFQNIKKQSFHLHKKVNIKWNWTAFGSFNNPESGYTTVHGVSQWILSTKTPIQFHGCVKWDLWWTKWRKCGSFSLSTSVFPFQSSIHQRSLLVYMRVC